MCMHGRPSMTAAVQKHAEANTPCCAQDVNSCVVHAYLVLGHRLQRALLPLFFRRTRIEGKLAHQQQRQTRMRLLLQTRMHHLVDQSPALPAQIQV